MLTFMASPVDNNCSKDQAIFSGFITEKENFFKTWGLPILIK